MEAPDLRARLRAANETILLLHSDRMDAASHALQDLVAQARVTFRAATLAVKAQLYTAEIHLERAEEVVRLAAAHARHEGLMP